MKRNNDISWMPADMKQFEGRTRDFKTVPVGYVSITSLRYYFPQPLRDLAVRMRSQPAQSLLEEIRAGFQQYPTSKEFYLARTQVDPSFRLEEWEKLKGRRELDPEICFRRGVCLLYRAYDWQYLMPTGAPVFKALFAESRQALEFVWGVRPSVMCGAVLTCLYNFPSGGPELDARVEPFTEDFLKFADSKYAYPQFLRAKAANFPLMLDFDPGRVPPEMRMTVAGILGERWSHVYVRKGPRANEVVLLHKWKERLVG